MKVGGKLFEAGANFSTIWVRQHINAKEAFAPHAVRSEYCRESGLLRGA